MSVCTVLGFCRALIVFPFSGLVLCLPELSRKFAIGLHFPPFVLTFAWPGGACIRFPFFFFPLSFPPVRAFRLCETGRTARCRPARPAFRVRPFRVPARPRRHPFPPFPVFPSVRGAPAIVSAPSAAVRLFPVFPEFRAIPFPPAPFRPFSSRGPRPRVYYYKVQPRFPRPFLSNIRKSFHFPSFFSFESLAVRDILVTFALAFGNDVPPGRRVSPANEERVL